MSCGKAEKLPEWLTDTGCCPVITQNPATKHTPGGRSCHLSGSVFPAFRVLPFYRPQLQTCAENRLILTQLTSSIPDSHAYDSQEVGEEEKESCKTENLASDLN